MSDGKCPYCGLDIYISNYDGFGLDESETYQEECWNCGKVFTFTCSHSISYSFESAPCLNGDEDHDYQPTICCPDEYRKMRCNKCKDEMSLDKFAREIVKDLALDQS